MLYTGELTMAIHEQRLTIAYSDTPGDPTLTPIFYLPGWGCTKEDIAGALSNPDLATRRIVSFDYPGYGDSPVPPDSSFPFRFDQFSYLALTTAIHRRLEVGRAAIIGHGAGGADGVAFAAFHPDMAAGLVSVMGSMNPSDCFLIGQIARMSVDRLLGRGFDEYVQGLATSDNPGMRRYVKQIRRFDDAQKLNYHHHARVVVRHCITRSLLPRFLEFKGHKLFVHGETEQAAYLNGLQLTGVPVASIKGADQFPFVDKPAEYFKVLGDFMMQLDEDPDV